MVAFFIHRTYPHDATANIDTQIPTSRKKGGRMSRKSVRSTLLPVAALVAAAVLSGCGGSEDKAIGNAADAAFVADMIPHHEGAVVMAEMAQDQAESPELQAMADEIISAQEAEIAEMETIAEDLPDPEGGATEEGGSMEMGMGGGDHSDHSGHMGMDASEMGMDMDPAQLADAADFDLAFVKMMIPHHEGAIEMAEDLLAEGQNAELQSMALSIIESQSAEIEQMKAWQKEWSSGP
jgi:uncharacterized protein (DUF305 family)